MDLEDSHQEKGMEEEVEAEKPDQLKEEKKVMSGKAPKKSADQGTEEGSSVAFCSPRAHYLDKYQNRAAVIQLLHEELHKSQLYPSGMEEDVCFPILINFMRNLTDRQWEVIQEGMRNPTTKVQLAKMCRKIAKTVSHIAVEILIPTLAQILELDSAGEASSSPSLTGSECANIASIQEHVVKLNEDGLPKRTGSERSLCSPRARTPSPSATDFEQSHMVTFDDKDLSTRPSSGRYLYSQWVKSPYPSSTEFEQRLELIRGHSYHNRELTASGSGRHYYSSHTPTPRSSTSSQTSLQRAHRVDVQLTDPLNALFGITEATILQTLGDQSCSSGSPGLTRSMVRDVVSQVNSDISLIISCSSSGKSRPVLCDTGRRYAMQAAQKLVSVICAKLRRFGITGKAAPQAKTNPSKEIVDIEASLAPLTGEVMAVMVNSRECQGGEQGTMDVLREITHKVNVLASRDSVGGLLEDTLAEEKNLKETVSSGSLVSPNILILSPSEKKLGSPVMTTIEKFSSGELKSEATNAISEVLIRSSRSLSAQMSACTPEHSCNLASERNLPAMPELLTTTINVGSEASEIMDSFLSDMTCIAQSDFTKMKALPAALNLSKRLQNTLRGFYTRLLAPNSSERDKEENLEQAKNISAPTLIQKSFGSNKSERMLPGVISPGEVALHRHQSESSRPTALSPQIIQLHLNSTTKEVVSTIVSCYKPEVPEEELTYSHEKMSSDTSLLATEFVDNVIAWLKVISAASSATSSSESLCVSPNAFICELSSETFQTQAVKQVKQVLIESVRCFSNSGSSSISESHTSLVSQSDFGIQQDSSSTSFMSMDSSSFGVVAAVVKDMKSLLQTTESTDSLQPTDSALLHGTTSYSETSSKSWQSGVAISDFKLWSTAQTIYRHLRNNLREFFIRHHQPDVKTTDAIIMQAKKSSSQILLAIQEEMTRSEELMTSRELVQLHGIVGMMLEGVETVCSEDDTEQEWQELQRPSTSLSTASKGSRSQRLNNTHTLPGTPMSTELLDSSFPVIRSTCIDARDDIASGASLSDLGKTLNGVVSFIIEHIDPEVMQRITSPDSDLTSLEELISKEKIHSLCHDLVDQLESLIREQNSIPLIKSVAVTKCVSDTVLLNLARRENQVGKPFSSKLIYMFAEELMNQLLLPLILPPSLWGLDQEASLYDVPSSTSSHRSSSSTTSRVTVLDGSSSLVSASSSQVYDDTVNLFTSAICHQVMDNISGASSHTVEDNIHDREASIIATGSVDQDQSDSSSPPAVKQGKWRFRFLPKFSKFRLNLKDLEDSHQEKGMEEEVEAEKPDAQLKEEKKVMSGKAPKKSADQGTEEVAFCSPRAHYLDKYQNRAAVIQLLHEELRKSQLYPSGMEEDVCFPILINFMRNLTDRQWKVIQEGMINPTTKVQLAKMCRKIAKTVSHIAVEILIPTLAQILELDSAGEASSSPSLTGSECANIASIQEHVVKLNEDGLPKRTGSGRSLCSPRARTPSPSAPDFEQSHMVTFDDKDLSTRPSSGRYLYSQWVKSPYPSSTEFEQRLELIRGHSYHNRELTASGSGRHYYSSHTPTPRSSTSSQTSLQRAHRGDVQLTDPLNALFGITEATILQTLGDQSCSSGSPGLTRSVVRDVVSQVNSDISLIISCSSSGKSRPVLCDTGRRYAMQAAQKLVSVICAKLRRFGITGQAAPQAKTNPSKEIVDIEASLAPLTGEVMAVMVNSRECQGGEQGTMDVLREITHKVNVLASRDSVGGLLEDSLAEEKNLKETVSSGSLVSPNILILSPSEKKLGSPVMTTIEKFSSGELKSEATNAISEVLIRSSRSLSAQMSACTPEHSCNLASERNLPAMPELLTTTINVGSEASEIMDSFLSDMTCIAQSDFTKMKALPAALNLSKRLQNTLRGFYTRLLAPNSSERDKEENLEQAKNISAPTLIQKSFGSNKSERMLPGVISPGEVALHRHQSESSRPTALSPQIIQLHLNSTTKEVVSTIVSCYKPEVPEEELTYSHEKMSSDTSLLATEFVDHVIAWLKVISAASSATSSSESLCVSPNAFICELSSETFQTQAVKQVKQVLIEYVRCFSNSGSSSISESHTSLVSQSDFGIQQDSSSTSFMSMDSSSFGVVAAVVKDMKSLLQTTESTDSLQPTDSALLHGTTSYSETSSKSWQSGVAISDFKLWSTAQTIYRHLRNNLREFFIRHHQPDVKTTDAIIMQAKKSSSQILHAIQEEMTRSEELMTSRELVQLHGIVGMMLEGVETVCSEDDTEQEWQELQRPSTSLSTASKGSRSQRLNNTHTLPGTPMSTELLDSSFPVIRSTCIDARDDIASGASLSDLGKTLNGVVSFIIEHIDPEVMQRITSPDSDLTSLEELISKEKIHSLCHDLVDQLESLIREQNSIPLIKSVAVTKCVSDTVLLNLARRENQVGKTFSSKLIYMFAEELVKQLLLPLILPPSLWGLDQEASLYDVPSSTSSHRSSSSTTARVTVLDGSSSLVSASSSQVYDDTVNLFTSAICHQVMDNISGASSHTVEDNIHDRDASIIATGSVDQAQSDSSSPPAVKQGKWRFRFLPKISKFRLNLKCFRRRNKKEVQPSEEAQDQIKFPREEDHCILPNIVPKAAMAPLQESCLSTSQPKEKKHKPSIFVRMFSAINKCFCNTLKCQSNK